MYNHQQHHADRGGLTGRLEIDQGLVRYRALLRHAYHDAVLDGSSQARRSPVLELWSVGQRLSAAFAAMLGGWARQLR